MLDILIYLHHSIIDCVLSFYMFHTCWCIQRMSYPQPHQVEHNTHQLDGNLIFWIVSLTMYRTWVGLFMTILFLMIDIWRNVRVAIDGDATYAMIKMKSISIMHLMLPRAPIFQHFHGSNLLQYEFYIS